MMDEWNVHVFIEKERGGEIEGKVVMRKLKGVL